jgi:hypothetical protein
MKSSIPKCPKCGGPEFDLRVLREEGLAATRCLKCSANYLLLDSKDYWFDVIQKGYPRLTRCTCKNESFRLRIDYNYRDDGDIDYIQLHTICSKCKKTRRQLDFEVDYSPTAHLIDNPLVRCRNPKILYDLKSLHLLITLGDITRIVNHLAEKANCEFLTRVRRGENWVNIGQRATEVLDTIKKSKYLFIYAMPKRFTVTEDQVGTIKKENAFWKRSEVIRISSQEHVCTYRLGKSHGICYCSDPPTVPWETEVGLAFYIEFSNEFAHAGKIVPKSEGFRNATDNLLRMLRNEFVCWRGSDCFDDPEVNIQVFGDEFRKNATGKKKL